LATNPSGSALLGFGFFRGNEGIKKTHAARADRLPEFFVAGLVLLLKGLDFAPEFFGSAQRGYFFEHLAYSAVRPQGIAVVALEQ